MCSCQRRDLGVGRPDGERPGHVGEAGALDVVREEVADEVVVVRHAAAALVVAVRRLRPVRDDQVVPAAARRGERLHRGSSEELAGQGLAVHEPAAVGGLRSLEKRGDRGHPGLRRARGAPDAVELPRASSVSGGRRRSAGRGRARSPPPATRRRAGAGTARGPSRDRSRASGPSAPSAPGRSRRRRRPHVGGRRRGRSLPARSRSTARRPRSGRPRRSRPPPPSARATSA